MSEIPYTIPYYKGDAFNCPHCGAYAKQEWSDHWNGDNVHISGLNTTQCYNCKSYSIWWSTKLIYPEITSISPASIDLPTDVREDYEEAAQIAQKSPRSAAALLRLAMQKLCVHLGGTGNNLNKDIAELVKNGLPVKVQQMLDTVRVIGNHSVHAGEINLNDNPQTAETLFRLVNKIAKEMISDPKELEAIYSGLPETDIEQINKRDSK